MELLNNNIIFNTIDNGIMVLDDGLNIKAWNKWLEVKTGIKASEIVDHNICEKFPYIEQKKLIRKIKSVLITKNPSFFSVEPHEYLIKIKSNIIMGKVFKYMRQDITLVPYDSERKLVCLYIYDHTKLHESSEKLKKLNEELKELSSKDHLTQLYNRRYFTEAAITMQSLSIRNNHHVSIIILDVDNFKNINDTYGHSVGDNVIVSLSRILENNCRKSDIVARFGGEEFVILLYNTSLSFAQSIAENIRENVEDYFLEINKEKLSFTLSLGVAQFDAKLDKDIESTINRADKALYAAKESGKNKVVTDNS
ncbi:diguanylate cyclase [Arcobacter sp.]|uniref:GGDEF domain-containing protein n=1 Tax=Arcobacter sp. TaxID=1872629 RepID=UPI003D0E1082